MSSASVRRLCHVVRDTIQTNDDYVQDERVLVISAGGDTLIAAIDDNRVTRIDVLTPGYSTADSLRVGTLLRRLLKKPGVEASVGEASVFAHMPAHCGLGFVLSAGGGDADVPITVEQLRHWSPTIYVTKIWVSGCRS